MLTTALTLASLNLPVFPCHRDTKAPITPRGFKDATTDPNQIEKWWGKWPDARVGLPTGEIVAIDIDAKHQPGLVKDFLTTAKESGLDWLDALPKQATPNGGGAHFLFRSPVEIRNRKLANNADKETIIETRGKGGYICIYDLNLSKPIRELSEAQIEALMGVARSFDCSPAKTVAEPRRTPWQSTGGMSPGDDYNQRGDVFDLLRSHGWHAISQSLWRRPGKDRGISATWDRVPGKFFCFTSNAAPLEPDHSYSPFALYAFLECEGNFAEATRALRVEGFGGETEPDPQAKAMAEAVIAAWEARNGDSRNVATADTSEKPKIVIFEHADRLEYYAKPPPWIIENVIAEGDLACWTAPPGVGKTLLSIETSDCVGSGTNFASHKVHMPGRVLYLCTDAPRSTMRRMLALSEGAKHNVSSVAEFPPLPGGIVELAEILEANKERPYRLVVLDTWDSTRDHSDGSWAGQDGSVEMVMRGLRKLADVYRVAILIVHHTTREGQRTRGSGVFDARMDVIGLVEQKEGVLSLSLIKARDSEARVVGKWGIETSEISNGNEVPVLEWQESAAESMPANHLAVLKAVNSGADSLSSIVQKSKVSKTSVRRAIEKLREAGFVEMEAYLLTPEGREIEEIRLQSMVDQMLKNEGFLQ